MKFRKRLGTIEATQWHKHGDHPLDVPDNQHKSLVRWYMHPRNPDKSVCACCGRLFRDHGCISFEVNLGGVLVCPGDWIVTDINGRHYPYKPAVFEETYEPVQS